MRGHEKSLYSTQTVRRRFLCEQTRCPSLLRGNESYVPTVRVTTSVARPWKHNANAVVTTLRRLASGWLQSQPRPSPGVSVHASLSVLSPAGLLPHFASTISVTRYDNYYMQPTRPYTTADNQRDNGRY